MGDEREPQRMKMSGAAGEGEEMMRVGDDVETKMVAIF